MPRRRYPFSHRKFVECATYSLTLHFFISAVKHLAWIKQAFLKRHTGSQRERAWKKKRRGLGEGLEGYVGPGDVTRCRRQKRESHACKQRGKSCARTEVETRAKK